jgi:hypothetical protein
MVNRIIAKIVYESQKVIHHRSNDDSVPALGMKLFFFLRFEHKLYLRKKFPVEINSTCVLLLFLMNFIILLTTSSKLLTEKFRGDDDGEKLIEFFDEIFFHNFGKQKISCLEFSAIFSIQFFRHKFSHRMSIKMASNEWVNDDKTNTERAAMAMNCKSP